MRSPVPASRTCLPRASAIFALALLPSLAHAQIPFGPLDDASVLARGALRIDAMFRVARAEERYGLNTSGRRNGSLEPLAIDFNVADLGVAQLPGLGANEQGIRAASGLSSFTLSLGTPAISSEVSSTTVPVSVELGITSRLTLGVMVPYVRTRNQVRADFNRARAEGNTGINPGLAAGVARTTNTAFRDQVTNAAGSLRAALDFCSANPGSGNCPALESNRAAAEALIVESRAFRDQVEVVYGSDTASNPALFVPRANSTAQSAVEQRAATLNAQYRSLLGLSPDAADPIAARPFAAQTPIAAGQARTLFTDPDLRLGLLARPPETVERSHVGDIEVGAKFLLLDTFGAADRGRFALRAAIAGAFRIATGKEDDPDDFFDVPTGDGQNDIDIRAATDLGFSRRFVASARARYTMQLADETVVRITEDPSDVFAAAYRRQTVERNLGDIIELDVLPRYALSEYFAVVGQYVMRRKAEDEFTGTFTVPGATTGVGDVVLDASTLSRETEATEQRAGLGFTFSLQPAARAGTVRRPIELSYMHSWTVHGSGGNQPKWSLDVLQLRIGARFLGR